MNQVMATANFGLSTRGKRTLLHRNYEFWRKKENAQGQTHWRCCKHQIFKCKAKLVTDGDGVIIGNQSPDHTHSGNVAMALARKAVGVMKEKMTETVATPSSSSGAVMAALDPQVRLSIKCFTSRNDEFKI